MSYQQLRAFGKKKILFLYLPAANQYRERFASCHDIYIHANISPHCTYMHALMHLCTCHKLMLCHVPDDTSLYDANAMRFYDLTLKSCITEMLILFGSSL